MPFLTIIIPCYNSKKYIKNALMSIYLQKEIDIKNDIEVIIVDDQSTETDYLDIVHTFDDRLNIKIFYTNKDEIRGPGQARNVGIDNATGSYITFLDHDDVFVVDTFWNVKREAVNNNYPEYILTDYEEFRRGYTMRFNSWSFLHGKFYKLGVIKEHNIRFNKSMIYYEDFYFQKLFFSYTSLSLSIPIITYTWTRKDTSLGEYYEQYKKHDDIFYLKVFNKIFSQYAAICQSNERDKEYIFFCILEKYQLYKYLNLDKRFDFMLELHTKSLLMIANSNIDEFLEYVKDFPDFQEEKRDFLKCNNFE